MAASGSRSLDDLKQQVVHALETNGVLGQIRAQLRANVFRAIDAEEEQEAGATTAAAGKLFRSAAGHLMAEVVAEFLDFYDFRHSYSVLLPEANLSRERRSRAEVASDAGLGRVRNDASILEQLMDQAMGVNFRKGGEGYHSSSSSTTASSPPPGHQAAALAAAAISGLPNGIASATASTRPSTGGSSDGAGGAGKASTGAGSDSDGPAPQEGGRHAGPDGDRARLGVAQAASQGTPSSERAGPGAGGEDAGDGAERRKPSGKLPALGGGGGPSKEPAPAVRAAAAGGVGGAPAEDVSLDDASFGASRDTMDEVREDLDRLRQLDRQAAGLRGAPAAAEAPAAVGVAGAAGVGPLEAPSKDAAEASLGSAASLSGPPAGSPRANRLRSAVSAASASRSGGSTSPPPARSRSQSPASGASRSDGVRSAGSEDVVEPVRSVHSASGSSAGGGPAPAGNASKSLDEEEVYEESISGGSDASLDLTAGRGPAPGTAGLGTLGRPLGAGGAASGPPSAGGLSAGSGSGSLAAGPARRLPDEVEDDLEEESIGEDIDEGSIEGYQSNGENSDDNF